MDILEELRKDREKGAQRLVEKYQAGLMALALRLCRDPGDAEELVNRTFAAVIEGLDGFLEQSSFFTWMCKILTNIHANDTRRKSNDTIVYPGNVPEVADSSANEEVYKALDATLLREAIDTLPEDVRKTILLHYFMDLSVKDIARLLTIPVGTVKWRLLYARQILAAKLGAPLRKGGAKSLLLALAFCVATALGAVGVAAFRDAVHGNSPQQEAAYQQPSGGLSGDSPETGDALRRQETSTQPAASGLQSSTLQPKEQAMVRQANLD